MELFKAITILKTNKALTKSLVINGVVSANIFTEHEIYQRLLKMINHGSKKTKAVKELALEYKMSTRYVWKIIKRFTEQ